MAFLKTFYERVNVDFELDQISSNESCIILKDKRDKDIFMNLSEKLSGIEGFSQPSYVPKWKMIRHKGPYLAQYGKEPFLGSVLIDKVTRQPYKLSPEGEKAAFLYAALLTNGQYRLDSTFLDNYWKDLQTYMDPNQPFTHFDDIEWKDVVAKYKKRIGLVGTNKDKYKHGFVEVDGFMYTATPFAADDMSIFFGDDDSDARRGRIRRAIKAADVTLNLSSDVKHEIPNISEFKNVVYKPGMKWAAKWNQPITGRIVYMDIFFNNPTEQEFVENFVEMYESDEESEGDDVDYGEDSEDEGNLFGDIDDLSSEDEAPDIVNISEVQRRRYEEAHRESIPRDEQLDLDVLDDEEFDLPFSYLIHPQRQWEYVLDACKSQFKVVDNLGKVNNRIIDLVSNVAAIALRDRFELVPNVHVNTAFIQYAGQR